MTAIVVTLWLSVFASFGWGVLRFFQKPDGMTRDMRLVATLGTIVGAVHLFAVATSRADIGPRVAGALLLAASGGLFWAAVRACESRRLTAIFATDAPSFLIRTGPFRLVRHPFYASYTIFWLGGAVASMSLVALIAGVVMLAIYLDAIRREERKFAASAHAEEYAAYRRSAGMLIPKMVGRGRGSTAR